MIVLGSVNLYSNFSEFNFIELFEQIGLELVRIEDFGSEVEIAVDLTE